MSHDHALDLSAVRPDPRRDSVAWLYWLIVFLVLGYLLLRRFFAHLGVSPLYVGELTLMVILICKPQALLQPFIDSFTRHTTLSAVTWLIYASIGFGAIQVLRGFGAGYSGRIALQSVVFNLYPIFLFVGVWLGCRYPNMLAELIYVLAVTTAVFGLLYLGVLARYFPAFDGQPMGSAVALLGLLAFEPRVGRYWLLLLLNALVMLGVQVRAEWVGFAAGLTLLALLTNRFAQLCKLGAFVFALLAIGFITDFSVPAPSTRGGEVSARYIVGRGLAAVDEDMAATLIPSEAGQSYASTVSWRTAWWEVLWAKTHSDPIQTLIGPGYGYPIWLFHPHEDLTDRPVRTPHNIFMFALVYGGWTGVFLFYGLQVALGLLLWRVYRKTGQAFGLCYWLMILVWTLFDNYFEAPFGAIPFYLIIGLAIAPLLSSADRPGTVPQKGAS